MIIKMIPAENVSSNSTTAQPYKNCVHLRQESAPEDINEADLDVQDPTMPRLTLLEEVLLLGLKDEQLCFTWLHSSRAGIEGQDCHGQGSQ
ncbi:hypothetical protein CLU79DRAFT_276799 [Phycomyces nitens]|nr:hypothetical protein CLU79DRAFT_276799 [Phycomyces nitens]